MNPLDLFTAQTASLRSPLSPQACAERLAAVTDGPFTLLGTRPLIGTVGAGSFAVRRRINYRNSFQTLVSARLEPSGSGTTIRGRFGVMGFVMVFMVVWVVLIVAALIGFGLSVAQGGPDAMPGWALLIPFGLLGFGFLMAGVGRWFARADAAYLLETIREAVDGTVVEKDPNFLDVDRTEMERMKANTSVPLVAVMVVVGVVLALGVAGFVFYLATPQP